MRERGRLREGLVTALVWSSAALVALAFGALLVDLLKGGAGRLSWSFLVESPRKSGLAGGIGPILVSTAAILGVCLAAALPVGLGTAVLLAEFSSAAGPFGRLVRRSLDVLAAVPSIVFGLFGSALFCRVLGLGFSILSGGLTLACMVLPVLIRSTEEGLRAVPDDYRRAAAALGLTRTAALRRVLLPVAMPGVMAGVVLGVGRALAETAALLFTSGYVDRMPRSLLDSGRAVSVHIYDLAMNVPGGDGNAHASALVLTALSLGLYALASASSARLARRQLGAA